MKTKCGFVSLLGYPNAGKSTLMNALVGQKVSIVTPKPQTTRRRIQGISTLGDTQIIFVDTPGIFKPKQKLEHAIVKEAFMAFKNVDLRILVIDASDPHLELLQELAPKISAVVLNKIDRVRGGDGIARLTQEVKKIFAGDIFPVSAVTAAGLDTFKIFLKNKMPESPFLFEEDQLTNISEKLWASEITREKAMLLLHQELPYELFVETESYEIFDNGDIKMHQSIVVSRDNLKGMVIGKGGSMLKKIGESARLDMAEQLGQNVHLFLNVKVKEKWQEKESILRSLLSS